MGEREENTFWIGKWETGSGNAKYGILRVITKLHQRSLKTRPEATDRDTNLCDDI